MDEVSVIFMIVCNFIMAMHTASPFTAEAQGQNAVPIYDS